MKFVRLVGKNALRNRRRTALTILSIAVSMFLVSTLQAVLTSMYRSQNSREGSPHLRVVVHRATSITQAMPEAYRARIASVPGVTGVVAVNWFGGQYIDASNFFANFAVDTDGFHKVFDELQIPPDQLAAWKGERTAALVGEKLMEKFHWKIGDRITLKGTIYPINPETVIRAVYTDPEDPTQERAFYFHYDYFDELLGRPGQVGTFTVKVDSAPDVPKVSQAIDAMFHNTAAETKTETEQAFQLSFVSMLGNVKLLLTAISAAVVFTILLVAGNTMAMSIRERTNEVAVLKTLGFRRRLILLLLVGEALVIALLGGIVGSVGAKAAYAFIRTTYPDAKILGLVFALAVAAMVGYGTWVLFGGAAGHGWRKGLRYGSAIAGGLIGLGLGEVFYTGVGFVMNQGFFLADFSIPTSTVMLCLGIAAAVGILSALFPALRASRSSIAEALRYVG
jgi:putative ABC transport system permease protein